MKIIRFLGGLGNQMFQYAFYKSLQHRFPHVKADLQGYQEYTLHNGFELEHIFNIKVNSVSSFTSDLFYNKKWLYRKLRRILNLRNTYIEEKKLFSFDPSLLNNPKSAYYWGYWQNFQYFEHIADDLRKDFQFRAPLSAQNQEVLDQTKLSNSISLHIRRGDYIKDPLLGGLCGPEYYQTAINYITSKVNAARFFIFSDDIDWCIANLKLQDCSFISWNKGTSSYIDMQLMSSCKHHIVANSSFSWWAAWLNPNPDKIVIAPEKWTNDKDINVRMSFPQGWISL
ncbi:alpha-1,2-fucosyltransferase [Pedobacter heparinus]|uniref:Glycosyl transferase family 11 n=1 Tax=Pedobacter heparinus (strain ATCC 13125 / DSM 2366 / CIP 104194 / JCM 7457 / NBRC 12017 / NCIMB 9290 / NRRL B-14731 / HIM 762-3) TaxID=485917 RepID=C6XYA5_PEDHD|nr:alpha-1,2-fucosyltransferase [Pedobacter heparinus]ACU02372.1 glycosyl transferase family 11 [Pedobacter heparinus DSM 2366]